MDVDAFESAWVVWSGRPRSAMLDSSDCCPSEMMSYSERSSVERTEDESRDRRCMLSVVLRMGALGGRARASTSAVQGERKRRRW
jgi:hypothetical protein